MTDHLDREIQGLMVKVMSLTPDSPAFPQAKRPPTGPRGSWWQRRSKWEIAFASGYIVFVLIAIPVLLLNRGPSGPAAPPNTAPETSLPPTVTSDSVPRPNSTPSTSVLVAIPQPELLTVDGVEASTSLGTQWGARNLIDGDLTTEWQDKSLRGEDAALAFIFRAPVFVDHILIHNLLSEARFTQNYKIKGIEVLVDGDPVLTWQMGNANTAPHQIPLGVEVSSFLQIRVISTYPSEPFDNGVPFTELAVAEVEFYGHIIPEDALPKPPMDVGPATNAPPACEPDQIAAEDEIGVQGATERDAANAGLGEVDDSGTVFEPQPDGTWSLTDSEWGTVVVIPDERDGTWYVDTLFWCLDRQNPNPVVDGELDCETDRGWSVLGQFPSTATGPDDPQQALTETLSRYLVRYGGEIVTTGPFTATLVVDAREVVTARATELGGGGYGVGNLQGCDGYAAHRRR